MRNKFDEAEREQLDRLELGQLVFSKTHGLCVLLRTKTRSWPATQSEVDIRLIFSRHADGTPDDNHEITVFRCDLITPHHSDAVLNMIVNLQKRGKIIRAVEEFRQKPTQINFIEEREATILLTTGKIELITSATYRLHHMIAANTEQPPKWLEALYKHGLHLMAGILVKGSIQRRRGMERQPSAALGLYDQALDRTKFLLDGRFLSENPHIFVEFDAVGSERFTKRREVAIAAKTVADGQKLAEPVLAVLSEITPPPARLVTSSEDVPENPVIGKLIKRKDMILKS